MASVSATSTGVSAAFTVTAEDLQYRQQYGITQVDIDGVSPPTLGVNGGMSHAMRLVNTFYPWIDEKVVEPKFDGVCKYLGMPSNRPTFVKDYHYITLCRAVDYILAADYIGTIEAEVGGVIPAGPPLPGT